MHGAVRQCREFPRGAASAGDGPGDALDRRLIVDRARALIGVPFRLHGRGGDGIDCVGVAAAALGIDMVPTGYALRGGEAAARAWLDARLSRIAAVEAGAIVLAAPGPGQVHLGVWTGAGLVHADRGLGRVVERPGPPCWPVIGTWAGGR